jgi:hypothetical protein
MYLDDDQWELTPITLLSGFAPAVEYNYLQRGVTITPPRQGRYALSIFPYSLRFPISCRLGQRHGLQNITLTNVFC